MAKVPNPAASSSRTIYPSIIENTSGPYTRQQSGLTRQRTKNVGFSGGNGALGVGDRGAFQSVPNFTGNPYDSQDYVFRWRQYVHLYELSWEARKIIRIPVEDAFRKPWVAEGLPDDMAQAIQTKLSHIRIEDLLKRSCMLERLLGGCLTFMGLESTEDDPAKPYKPKEGAVLRFMNSIPISRISRVSWSTDPLGENYMRPEEYLVNGHPVHVSRCLVWDGEPLFDPYDFALTNFRTNLAGFGPSKLAPVWDDIIKAVGTRQAAYQLIQTNNAIIMAVEDLQDISGTKPGQQMLAKLKEIANNLSVYRAAMVDKNKAEITQSPASFGSVPELLITYLQVLSAASDIPATRFLGQAPGGLNATGESDLENYYNVIDAFQRQRIEPQLRRLYDIVGYQLYPEKWELARKTLRFKFPPLWNLSELEEADYTNKVLTNLMLLHDAGKISDEHFFQELNARGLLTVKLDDTDLTLMGEFGGEPGGGEGGSVDPQKAIAELTGKSQKTTVDLAGGGKEGESQRKQAAKVGGGQQEVANRIQNDGFNSDKALRNIFYDCIRDTKSNQAVTFDLENDEPVGDYQEFTHAPKEWEPSVKILYRLYSAGGDWETPVLYFRCQVVEGSVKGLDKKRAGCFCYIPKKSEGNRTLWKDGKGWHASDDDQHQTTEVNDKELAEVSLKRYLDKLVKGKVGLQNAIPLDQLPEPSEAQKKAGNYKKHPVRLFGLDLSIENPKGSTRRGQDPSGAAWESTLPAHYGYVKRTEGADGDHVDVYVGDDHDCELVFIVDQKSLETGDFDEHKCILGVKSLSAAKALYYGGFSDGRGAERLQAITPVHIAKFKEWLTAGDTKTSYSQQVENYRDDDGSDTDPDSIPIFHVKFTRGTEHEDAYISADDLQTAERIAGRMARKRGFTTWSTLRVD